MRIIQEPAYSFDDVLLVPQHSSIETRQSIDLATKIGTLSLALPILSANMESVTESQMAIAMGKVGGAGVLHRFIDRETLNTWIGDCDRANVPVIVSMGLAVEEYNRITDLIKQGCVSAICIDVAHGHHDRVVCLVEVLRKEFPNLNIIAGNIATGSGANHLVRAGANIIKVGIGGGSLCTTRMVTGHGVPTLASIINVHRDLMSSFLRDKVSIIADGGIRGSADIVKCLAAGADAVMCGSILAGTTEASGDKFVRDGVTYKRYRGMASYEVQMEKRGDRKPRVEGVSTKVPLKGDVADIIDDLVAGIKSGLSYSGARNIKELREKAEFLVVSSNSLKESSPHNPYL